MIRAILALTLPFVLAACGADGPPVPPPGAGPVATAGPVLTRPLSPGEALV